MALDPLRPYLAAIQWVVGLALLGGWSWLVYDYADTKGDERVNACHYESAKAQAVAVKSARAEEQAKARSLATIGDQHEKDREDAENLPASVAADIDDGTLKLRRQWAACETSRLSDSAAAARERDALAELRRKDQGDLVRVGRDANDQLRACQAVVAADRAPPP